MAVAGVLTAVNVGLDYITLDWTDAHDAYGVFRYRLYQNGSLARADLRHSLPTTVAGLLPCTTYEFKVEAADPNGNVSVDGPSAIVRTLSPAAGILELIPQVETTVQNGMLAPGRGTQLISLLESAARQLESGHPNGAVQLLETFVGQLAFVVDHGELSPWVAEIWAHYASQVIASPSCEQ